MVRGIERRAIFRDARDRADFVAPLACLAEQGALTIYDWAPDGGKLLVGASVAGMYRRSCGGSPFSYQLLLLTLTGAFDR